ncbi:MAG: YfhO family protein [Candidatus Hydrogenedentota bacterium]
MPFIGAALLTVVVLGLAAGTAPTNIRVLLGGAIALIIAKNFGLPGLHEALASIPLLDRVYFPKHTLGLLVPLLTAAAALSVESIGRGGVSRQAAITAALIAMVSVVAFYFVWRLTFVASHDIHPSIDEAIRRASLADGFLAILASGAVIITNHRPRLAAVLVITVLIAEAGSFVTGRERPERVTRWDPPAWVEQLPPGKYRVLPVDGDLYPNTASALGIYDIQIIDAIYDRGFTDVARRIAPSFHERLLGSNILFHSDDAARLLGSLSVRILIARSTKPGDPWRPISNIPPWTLYENPYALEMVRLEGGNVSLIDEGPNHRKYIVESSGGLLIEAEAYDPGWCATIDDQDADVQQTDLFLRAIEVPAGKHVVVTRYRPLPFIAGLAISVLSLIVGTPLLYVRAIRSRTDTSLNSLKEARVPNQID